MAHAIISGLVDHGYSTHFIMVFTPSARPRAALVERYSVQSIGDNLHVAREADLVLLAITQQLIAQVCESLRAEVDFSGKVVLSIAAGVTVSRFYALLGENIAILRVMTNTSFLMEKG